MLLDFKVLLKVIIRWQSFCELQLELLLNKTYLHFWGWKFLCLKVKLSHSILQFKSSFPNPQSKSHHKIVLLFKYRDKWFYKLLHGGKFAREWLSTRGNERIFINPQSMQLCSWPIFLLTELALMIGTNGCSCWHKSVFPDN